jgi:pantoate--beta-alanine ligase
MEIFSEIQGLRQFIKHNKLQKKTIGFVPTMGALHAGHLQLVKTSVQQNDITVCSIFVNPTQFNNSVDLENYPREVDADIEKLKLSGSSAVFVPSVNIMYEKKFTLNLNFGYLENIMEGKYRPGHFKGVGLVVVKLLNLVNPDRAYFGKKDLQQLTIIKMLTKELFFDVEIIAVETVRASNGLALSSRNKLLTELERSQATDLYKALNSAKTKLIQGESVISVKKYIIDFFAYHSTIELEYFEIVKTSDLKKIDEINANEAISLCIAGYLGKVRLIDNISLN